MGILYLSNKFELDWCTNIEDLLPNRKKRLETQTHIQTETDTLPIKDIGSSKKMETHRMKLIFILNIDLGQVTIIILL